MPPGRARVTANLFGVSFGLVALAGTWRVAAAPLGVPGAVPDALALMAAVAWLAVGAGWVAQLAQGRTSPAQELGDPVLGPFVALIPVAGMLLALALEVHAGGVGRALFAAFAVHWLAHDRPDGWRIWAWLAIALITAFIMALLGLTVRAIARGRFFVRFGAGRP
jgi:tellurite resistance protein TehA-like permease